MHALRRAPADFGVSGRPFCGMLRLQYPVRVCSPDGLRAIRAAISGARSIPRGPSRRPRGTESPTLSQLRWGFAVLHQPGRARDRDVRLVRKSIHSPAPQKRRGSRTHGAIGSTGQVWIEPSGTGRLGPKERPCRSPPFPWRSRDIVSAPGRLRLGGRGRCSTLLTAPP
jgi:hypothetical protein